jgi:hypothetical protein
MSKMSSKSTAPTLSKPTEPISFVDLPGEIRNTIFDYAVSYPRVDAPEDKKWRGTTKALRLCRQAYQESHHLIHNIPVSIALSYHGRKLQKRHVFLSAKDWKKSIEWDKRWPDRHLTTNQIIQQRKVTVTVCYFEWEEWPVHLANSWGKFSLEEERDDHVKELKRQLREVYQVLRASRALEVLTLEFVRWKGAFTDDIDRTSSIYVQLPRFIWPFVTLPKSIDVLATSRTHNGPLTDDTEDPTLQPDRPEHLAPWLRAARKNYLMTSATSDALQSTTLGQFEPALYTRSDSYLPFYLDDKYMAHRKTRKTEWEIKEDQKYLDRLEAIQDWSEGPFPDNKVESRNMLSDTPDVKFKCKKPACIQQFLSRRSFRKHKYVRWHTWRSNQPASSGVHPRTYVRCRGCQGAFNKGAEYDAHIAEHVGHLRHWINRDTALYDVRVLFSVGTWDQEYLLGIHDIPDSPYMDAYIKGFAPDFEENKKYPPKFLEIVDVDHSDPDEFPEFKEPLTEEERAAHHWYREDNGVPWVFGDDGAPNDWDSNWASIDESDDGYPDD